MFKVIALMKKRAELTREQFIDYYENHHVPLACRLLPMAPDYRRSYALRARVNGQETEDNFVFDAVSEAWFLGEAAYQAFSSALSNPDIFRQISSDEAKFLDRAACKYLLVDERRTESNGQR